MASVIARWTTLADVRQRLDKRWDRGEFLRAWASGEPWTPLNLPLAGPSPGELGDHFDEARAWVSGWHQAGDRLRAFRVTTRRVGGRTIGANELPERIWIDSYDDLWRLLDKRSHVRLFDDLRIRTAEQLPALVEWTIHNPMRVLAEADHWLKLVRTAKWIADHQRDDAYLRQAPVHGVDTKFIERHRGTLAELLDWLLPPDRINGAATRSQFEARYGFAAKPSMVRFRTLDPVHLLVAGVRELCVRTEEFSLVAPDADTVYIVENEITYLAFPQVRDAVLLFGNGYALSGFAALPWLCQRRVVYWGDLDTHGFAILNLLRAYLPETESLLMDETTLLAHKDQWVTESKPTKATLTNLTPEEARTYSALINNQHGIAVRLEQERVGFPNLEAALQSHTDTAPGI
jgi:hypothetical protein